MPFPRYSLRTLLLVVTIVALWLGYSANWIRQRREFSKQPDVIASILPTWPNGDHVKAPWQIRILGEQGVDAISTPDTQREEAERLFPESDFMPYIRRIRILRQ